MNEKLKRCPFCGGEAEIAYHFRLGTGEFLSKVYCTKCGVMTPVYVGEEEAINAWNTRVKE